MAKRSTEPLLIETATTLRIMNERLFGGPGQPDGGALHFIMSQHKDLRKQLDDNKQELLDKIDAKKAETDGDIKSVQQDFKDLDHKVTLWSGGLAVLEFLIVTGLTWMGVKYHGRG